MIEVEIVGLGKKLKKLAKLHPDMPSIWVVKGARLKVHPDCFDERFMIKIHGVSKAELAAEAAKADVAPIDVPKALGEAVDAVKEALPIRAPNKGVKPVKKKI